MTVQVRGNKVIHVRGPQTDEHSCESNMAAVDLAVKLEELDAEERRKRLDLLAKYSSPDHPAHPVSLPAEALQRVIVDYHNATDPERSLPVPEFVAKANRKQQQTVAEEQADIAEVLATWHPITAAFEHEPERERVRVTLTSNATKPHTVHRQLPGRSGKTVIAPGREISRSYKLTGGEEVTLHLDASTGPVLARWTCPTPVPE